MWNIKKQIYDASKMLNIEVKELKDSQKTKLLKAVSNKYITNQLGFPLWERLKNAVSICNENSWYWIKDFIGSENAILFFNPTDEKDAYVVNSGDDVVHILGELFNIEFYLTNEQTSYLFCFNHHDVLLATGEAKEWLQELNR